MCELKIVQLKRANTLSTNPSIGGEGRVYMSVTLCIYCYNVIELSAFLYFQLV